MSTGDEYVECGTTQLNLELQSHVQQISFNANVSRPVLKHLNADSSWLLSFPYPAHVDPPAGRCRFNIIIDAWLTGPQVDFHQWFSKQEHAQPSSIQSLLDLDQLLYFTESEATKCDSPKSACYIDAVCCTHEFSDHCHESTLTELPRHVPVFAPKKAATVVRSWRYFEHVLEVSKYDKEHKHSLTKLPAWINFGRVQTKGDGPAYLHSAFMISFKLESDSPWEVIIYTPHGIEAEVLRTEMSSNDKALALLHGLHDISLAGSQLNLGKENALEVVRDLKIPYWSATHDEVKIARGLVSLLLKRVSHTLEMAPGSHPVTENAPVSQPRHRNFVDVGNGNLLMLERRAWQE